MANACRLCGKVPTCEIDREYCNQAGECLLCEELLFEDCYPVGGHYED